MSDPLGLRSQDLLELMTVGEWVTVKGLMFLSEHEEEQVRGALFWLLVAGRVKRINVDGEIKYRRFEG